MQRTSDDREADMRIRLNLGCGRDIRAGWINIDKYQGSGVDEITDLEKQLLIFESGSVDEVVASHVLEHCQNWEEVLLEIHRVLKPGGVLEVRVPFGTDGKAYHLRSFTLESMDFFTSGPEQNGLEPGRATFFVLSRQVNRQFPFAWHLQHYLKLKVPHDFIIGKRWEIVWRLMKIGEVGR